MTIAKVPNYNSLMGSGCSFDLFNGLKNGRIYGTVTKYGTEKMSIMSVFDFVVKANDCKVTNWPLFNPLQFLSMDYDLTEWDIDYLSFTSLN